MPEGVSVILFRYIHRHTHTHTHTHRHIHTPWSTARNILMLFIGILLFWRQKVRKIGKNYMKDKF